MRDVDTPRTDLVLGEPHRDGGWCPTCLRPSGYSQDMLALTAAGIEVVGTARGCTHADDPNHWPNPRASRA